MMSKIIFFMCVVGLLVPATLMAKVEKVTLKGAIKGLGNEELILMNSDRSEITRTKTKNDHFEIVTEVETGDLRYYILYAPSVGPLGPSMAIPTIHFFIDSPKITVEAELKDKQMCLKSLKGSPGWEEHNRILESLPSSLTIQKVYDRYNQAFHEYNEVEQTEENMKELKAASHEIDVLQRQRREEIFGLFPQYTTSMPFAVIISSYFGIDNIDEAEKVWNQFDPSIRHCYALKQLENLIQRGKNCAVGHEAPNFELITSTGGKIALSSLRGKYVLIDFWASWCGPCRREIPNIKKVYAEFKDKGLQVVGVSIDNSDKAWKKALEEENMDYLQLYDPEGITSKLYNYNGIPFIILISPEGIILEKGLRGENIREKITKYLK
ncbi:thiol:disulfide interchange protein [Odoribacteraceae bacterium]|nr:thiol:disulfide interchange protein [Odoribacteraceae bacterium]GKH91560.1 thiol:disulfide interchange protein [Odoribacteraceae bacterium]GKH96178.1 thiol:disulfide interchange protein [Odoribacteraceae bacterium]GKI03056.1 thiol:disulfide interchange protein [Odoribacteraceae bacterium]